MGKDIEFFKNTFIIWDGSPASKENLRQVKSLNPDNIYLIVIKDENVPACSGEVIKVYTDFGYDEDKYKALVGVIKSVIIKIMQEKSIPAEESAIVLPIPYEESDIFKKLTRVRFPVKPYMVSFARSYYKEHLMNKYGH